MYLLFRAFQNNRFSLLFLTLLGGVLLWLGWPVKPLPFFLFIGFVPLLLTDHFINQRSYKSPAGKFFIHAYFTFLVWNALTTWWVMHSTVPGGLAAMILNSLLMCIPAMAFFFTKRATNNTIGYISFVVYWLAFEYLHLTWDLTWPWLTLGNGFSSIPNWVQWYEFTGFMGGSLWVLVVNVIVFLGVKAMPMQRKKHFGLAAALIVLPVIISYIILANYEEQGKDVEVVVVQPNIDPYKEKFSSNENFITYEEQMNRLISLSEQKMTPETKFVVWPETAIRTDGGYWEESLMQYPGVQELYTFIKRHPNAELITGIDTYKSYPNEKSATPTHRYHENVGFYDAFNTALQVTQQGNLNLYHKSKLVPGVEKLPYPGFFKFLGPLAIDLGGTVGSLGSQPERTVFTHQKSPEFKAAPVICYESVYGEFVAEYMKGGANLIFIITNDGWWSDSPGYRQHLQYATLRAIETRRCIARSANTGISGFINQKGEITDRIGWWEQGSLRKTIKANTEITFYVRMGEYIGKGAQWLTIAFIIYAVFSSFISKPKRAHGTI